MKKMISIRLNEQTLSKIENIKQLNTSYTSTTQIIEFAIHELNKLEIKRNLNL